MSDIPKVLLAVVLGLTAWSNTKAEAIEEKKEGVLCHTYGEETSIKKRPSFDAEEKESQRCGCLVEVLSKTKERVAQREDEKASSLRIDSEFWYRVRVKATRTVGWVPEGDLYRGDFEEPEGERPAVRIGAYEINDGGDWYSETLPFLYVKGSAFGIPFEYDDKDPTRGTVRLAWLHTYGDTGTITSVQFSDVTEEEPPVHVGTKRSAGGTTKAATVKRHGKDYVVRIEVHVDSQENAWDELYVGRLRKGDELKTDSVHLYRIPKEAE